MKISALVNTAAGSVGPNGLHRMSQALGGLGLPPAKIVAFDRSSGERQVLSLLENAPDLLVVWGGDGTHRTALNAAGLDGANVLLLPGGTMNLLTKWIHGDRPWDETLRAVTSARATRTLNAGGVDDSLFFCALIAGVPARFALAREDVRVGDLARAFQDAGSALDVAAHLHLVARTGSGRDLAAGNVVAAMVGPLSRSPGMDVAGLNVPSATAALGLAWSSLRSDWRTLEGVDVRRADAVTISDPDGHAIPVIMDGEQVETGSAFTVRYREAAATCVVAA